MFQICTDVFLRFVMNLEIVFQRLFYFGPSLFIDPFDIGPSQRPRPSLLSPTTLLFDRHTPVSLTKAYMSGAIDMQDESSTVMSYFALHPELFLPLLSDQPGIQVCVASAESAIEANIIFDNHSFPAHTPENRRYFT